MRARRQRRAWTSAAAPASAAGRATCWRASTRRVPIGITVEGANILTRTMIIFGQGAIRCHPFVQRGDRRRVARRRPRGASTARSSATSASSPRTRCARCCSALTRRRARARAGRGGPPARVLRAALALVARRSRWSSDVAMGTLGGSLKRREKITGRLADALAWMYLGSAAVKRYVDDGPARATTGRSSSGRAATRCYEIQEALRRRARQPPEPRWSAVLLRPLVFPLGAPPRAPSDALGGARRAHAARRPRRRGCT